MDIHRSRFVPFPPSAINALAFSHPEANDSNNDPECLRLAIGRANGNIEIWNPANGAWLLEKVFYGGKDRSVEGLVWTQEPDEKDNQNKVIPGKLRLFSIGYSSSVTEWDLVTGLPARHSDGNHSEVWCFAAQPRVKTTANATSEAGTDSQKLIAGCADGTVVLLSTENDDLRFERFVSRSSTKKARALSITYKDRHIVLAGFADSMIRVFDTRNGNVLRNISLGSGPHGGPKEILVWKVKCLSNGDFVSGDSTGDIRIYNGKNYSQMQRISGHEADILDLGVSRDGTMIFSVGMDRRTCFYSSKKSAATRGTGGKWRKVSHKRYHEHDVKAMATYEGNKLSIVVSGGIDTQPVVVPLRQFGKELSRGLPALPHAPPLISAPNARLIISWWNSEVRIWRVKSQDDRTERPKVVARLALQGDENVTSASITQDGDLLAIATANVVKLFQLLQPPAGSGTGLRIRKIEVPTVVGARLVRLSADGKWLTLITASNEALLLRILPPEDESDRPLPLDKIVRLQRQPRPNSARNPLSGLSGEYARSIVHAEFSTDGKVFAVADLAGYVDTWVVEGHEDPTAPEIECDESVESDAEDEGDEEDEDTSPKGQVMFLGQRWIPNPSGHLLPRLDATPVLLSFQPTIEQPEEPKGNPGVHPTRNNPHPHSHEIPNSQYRLLAVSADHRLHLFDVLTGRLSEWSRRNPPSSYPTPYRVLDLPAKGCIWDTSEDRQRLWLYGEKWLFMFDLSKDFPIPESTDIDMGDAADETGATGSKKRKRDLLKDASRKHNTGAGDIIPEKEIPVTKLRKFTSSQADESMKQAWIDANDARKNAASDDEELEDSNQSLATLRRTNGESEENNNAGGEVGEVLDPRKSNEHWWHTFKYRPILGVVPIGYAHESQSPEVVLVERPSWDFDLPPKFVGSHEQ